MEREKSRQRKEKKQPPSEVTDSTVMDKSTALALHMVNLGSISLRSSNPRQEGCLSTEPGFTPEQGKCGPKTKKQNHCHGQELLPPHTAVPSAGCWVHASRLSISSV